LRSEKFASGLGPASSVGAEASVQDKAVAVVEGGGGGGGLDELGRENHGLPAAQPDWHVDNLPTATLVRAA